MPAQKPVSGAERPGDGLSALTRRITLARQSLAAGAPKRDPDLEANARIVRAHLDPAYAAELEREHAYEHRRGTGRDRGSAPRDAGEAYRCEAPNCGAIIAHTGATCAACGHVPDIAVGHRQHHRTQAQQRRARAYAAERRADLRAGRWRI